MLTVPLIRAADELAARQVKETYVGTYTSPPTQEQTINSTLTLTYTPTPGLEISEWVSNSTDLLSVMPEHFQFPRNKKIPRAVDSHEIASPAVVQFQDGVPGPVSCRWQNHRDDESVARPWHLPPLHPRSRALLAHSLPTEQQTFDKGFLRTNGSTSVT